MTIYLDRDSGTYFTEYPIAISTDRWDSYDYEMFSDVFTDEHRCQYADHVIAAQDTYTPATQRPKLLSPAEWYRDAHGEYQCDLCDTTATDAGIEGGVCAACFEAMPEGQWVTR